MNRVTKVLVLAAASLSPVLATAQGISEGPVVRPQLYTAGNKLEVGPVVGYVSNDPYNRIIVPGGVLTYHFSDRSAVDIHGGYAIYSPKQLLSQVKQNLPNGRGPDIVSRPKYFVSGNYMWAPIYGKINAFGEVVLHYDMYVLGGLGLVGDEIETNSDGNPPVIQNKVFPLTDFAFGQHFFFTKRTALRVEIRPYIFWEQIDNKWDPNGDVQILTGLTLLL